MSTGKTSLNRRIFVTGGTGFFGKSILDYLKRHPDFRAGDEWTILSRDPDGFRTRLDAKNDIRVLGVPASGMPPSVYVPDVSRAVRELGLRVTVSLADAVRKSTVLR